MMSSESLHHSIYLNLNYIQAPFFHLGIEIKLWVKLFIILKLNKGGGIASFNKVLTYLLSYINKAKDDQPLLIPTKTIQNIVA